jgi:sulfotransferase
MAKNIHFIAGLPRSGSTLLAAVLSQNPRFKAGMTSPLEHIYSSAIVSMSKKNNFHTLITEQHRKDVLRAIIEGYYKDVPGESVIFDTNKYWPTKLGGLATLFPNTKMICCVRDVVSVLNSFEHLVQKNPFEISSLFNFDPTGTVYTRTEALMHHTGSVGRALAALREALSGEHSERIILVDYDDLVSNPKKIVGDLYSELGEPLFSHDFENLSYEAERFDLQIGLSGMHTVRKKISKEERRMLLPKDLESKYRGLSW